LRPARVAVLKTASTAFAAVLAGGLTTIKGKPMKIILQSAFATAAIYVLATFGTAATFVSWKRCKHVWAANGCPTHGAVPEPY